MMNKVSALLLVLVALVATVVDGYSVAAPMRTRGPYTRGDYGYGSAPYMVNGQRYYRPSDLDWGNFSPNPAYHTNGIHNYYYYGGTGYDNDRYYRSPYYAGSGSRYYNYNTPYHNYGYDNYYYRPGRYNYNYNYGYNDYDRYDRRAYYNNMDWGAFSPRYGRRYNNYNRYW